MISITSQHINEIQLLSMFNVTTTQEGIKVHKSAEPTAIDAAQRLFQKGLITQPDGGYLTHQGIEAAEHTQALLAILKDA
ncbi:MAG: TIGR02647 family protein [Methylococcaceae bacterium]